MTEKNIFVYKFFVIKYFRVYLFYVTTATPPPPLKKVTRLFQQPPSKN